MSPKARSLKAANQPTSSKTRTPQFSFHKTEPLDSHGPSPFLTPKVGFNPKPEQASVLTIAGIIFPSSTSILAANSLGTARPLMSVFLSRSKTLLKSAPSLSARAMTTVMSPTLMVSLSLLVMLPIAQLGRAGLPPTPTKMPILTRSISPLSSPISKMGSIFWPSIV